MTCTYSRMGTIGGGKKRRESIRKVANRPSFLWKQVAAAENERATSTDSNGLQLGKEEEKNLQAVKKQEEQPHRGGNPVENAKKASRGKGGNAVLFRTAEEKEGEASKTQTTRQK